MGRSSKDLVAQGVTVDPCYAARQLLENVWNLDDDTQLTRLRRCRVVAADYPFRRTQNAVWLRNLVYAYKALVPDLRFVVDRERRIGRTAALNWIAEGHHDGLAAGLTPTGRAVQLRGVLKVVVDSHGHLSHIHGTWDTDRLLKCLGLTADAFERLLALSPDVVRLRAIFCHGRDVPLVFFPTLSLPGWVTWKRFIDAFRVSRNVASFESIATRLAFERRRASRPYLVRSDTHAFSRALKAAGVAGPIDVVGHSAGGTLALDFALEATTPIRSIVLIEPSIAWLVEALGVMDDELQAFVQQRLRAYRQRMTAKRYAQFLQTAYMERGYDPRQSPRWSMMCAYMRNMRYREALYTHTDDPVRLSSICCPVLLVYGRNSDRFHRVAVSALGKELPDARIAELAGGHVPHFGSGFLPFLEIVERFHESIIGRQMGNAHNSSLHHHEQVATTTRLG